MERLTECQIEIKKLRESTGMNRKEFCECFNIPYRTVTEWERGDWDIIVTSLRKPYKWGVSEVSPNLSF